MTCTGASHIAPNSAARCDSDLSPGRAPSGGRAAAGAGAASEAERPRVVQRRSSGEPRPARTHVASRPRAAQRARTAARPTGDDRLPDAADVGGRRTERPMSTMSIVARPRASAISATIPGRLGTSTRSSRTSPPARSASSSRRRSSRAASFQSRMPASSPPRAVAGASEPGHEVVDRRRQRVGVGAVDAAPHDRVGARHAGDVAEATGRWPAAARPPPPARARPGRRARWPARAAGG